MTKTLVFRVCYKRTNECRNVRAKSYESAAQSYAKKKFGRGAVAIRVTGINGKSGMFQAYKKMPRKYGGGLNSTGDNFHVG